MKKTGSRISKYSEYVENPGAFGRGKSELSPRDLSKLEFDWEN